MQHAMVVAMQWKLLGAKTFTTRVGLVFRSSFQNIAKVIEGAALVSDMSN